MSDKSPDEFAALDKLGTHERGEESTATIMLKLPAADMVRDMYRAREAGVTLAGTNIEPLPESPRAVLHFSDKRPPVTVSKSVFILGRAKEVCDVVIENDEQVSRQHAAILFSSGEFFLEDLHSTNGTFADGHRIQRVRLESEVPLRIGTLTITLRWEM